MTKEPTIQDVLTAVNKIDTRLDKMSNTIDKRFDGVDKRFQERDARFDALDRRIDDLLDVVNEFAASVDERFEEVNQKMVTKDYLDEKLADLRADLVLLARKGNLKFSQLVEELVERGSLAPKAAKRILALEPFPQG